MHPFRPAQQPWNAMSARRCLIPLDRTSYLWGAGGGLEVQQSDPFELRRHWFWPWFQRRSQGSSTKFYYLKCWAQSCYSCCVCSAKAMFRCQCPGFDNLRIKSMFCNKFFSLRTFFGAAGKRLLRSFGVGDGQVLAELLMTSTFTHVNLSGCHINVEGIKAQHFFQTLSFMDVDGWNMLELGSRGIGDPLVVWVILFSTSVQMLSGLGGSLEVERNCCWYQLGIQLLGW